MRAFALEGIFCSRAQENPEDGKKRTPAAKAGYSGVFSARLKPCPSGRVLTRTKNLTREDENRTDEL